MQPSHQEGFPFATAVSLVKLLLKHMAGLRPRESASRNSTAVSGDWEYQRIKLNEDAAEDEDEKYYNGGYIIPNLIKPFWVTVHLM